ncbi:Fic/DOC family protein [Gemmata sp. SH-PL17]|uniref:mobile mystery protein B n=1 Tax=Gemmata sp. SH-PL17 TaxID=1630693 RepID=UPI00078B67E5|nr:mobile mystery protein B [Gemmata sp. SH-PL17]AMV27688.1 Fic/DOC family protein [Gemmata sp. SH-PL17]
MKTDPGWVPIPGETPIDDVSGLLIKDIGTRGQLNQAEAENITLVVAKYFVGRLTEVDAPFTFDWVFALHKEMFGRVWAWAGTPRTCNLNLGCPAHDVKANVLGLVQDISYWGKGPYSLIEDAALLHYRAVKIHPFLNGNGRWARMLANIWLRLHGSDPVLWPEPQIGEVSPIRSEYIAAIQAADRLDYAPLVKLHQQYASR